MIILFQIVEAPLDDLDKKHFATLQGSHNERNTTVKKAQDAAAKAKVAIGM